MIFENNFVINEVHYYLSDIVSNKQKCTSNDRNNPLRGYDYHARINIPLPHMVLSEYFEPVGAVQLHSCLTECVHL